MIKKLLKKEEHELLSGGFRGKWAGVLWKYEQNLDGLVRTRIILFIMSLLVFYPVWFHSVINDFYTDEIMLERVVFSMMYLTAGLLFNKFRILALIIGMIPSLLIFSIYINPSNFHFRRMGFTAAIVILVASGFYHNFKVKQLAKQLEANLLENQILE